MASKSEILMQLSATQIEAMSKEEMSILLYGLIQLCGGILKNVDELHFDVLDKIGTKLDEQSVKQDRANSRSEGISKQLDDVSNKHDGIIATTEGVRNNIVSLTKRIGDLETAKNEMANSNLFNTLGELDQILRDSINETDEAHAYHQRMLEELDSRSRRNNLILIGVPEEEGSDESDLEKVVSIVKKTDSSISLRRDNFKCVRRLGLINSRPRPLLITLDDHETCKEILMNAKNLKDVSDCASIYIRKDTHATLRYEANRLRIREKTERNMPENSNADIYYDRKTRALFKNGIIIDRFRPSFL